MTDFRNGNEQNKNGDYDDDDDDSSLSDDELMIEQQQAILESLVPGPSLGTKQNTQNPTSRNLQQSSFSKGQKKNYSTLSSKSRSKRYREFYYFIYPLVLLVFFYLQLVHLINYLDE